MAVTAHKPERRKEFVPHVYGRAGCCEQIIRAGDKDNVVDQLIDQAHRDAARLKKWFQRRTARA